MRVGIVAAAAALLGVVAAASVRNVEAQNAGGQSSGDQQSAPQGDAQAGQKIFLADGCWECHGTVGQGGVLTGPRLAHTALPFAAVLQQLRVPQNAMPPYEASVVPDADVANIYAFLESLPASEPVANIPLLSQKQP